MKVSGLYINVKETGKNGETIWGNFKANQYIEQETGKRLDVIAKQQYNGAQDQQTLWFG